MHQQLGINRLERARLMYERLDCGCDYSDQAGRELSMQVRTRSGVKSSNHLNVLQHIQEAKPIWYVCIRSPDSNLIIPFPGTNDFEFARSASVLR